MSDLSALPQIADVPLETFALLAPEGDGTQHWLHPEEDRRSVSKDMLKRAAFAQYPAAHEGSL
jgi:hypothetical protein